MVQVNYKEKTKFSRLLLSLEKIITDQIEKIEQLEIQKEEIKAENKALQLESAELKEKLGLNFK